MASAPRSPGFTRTDRWAVAHGAEDEDVGVSVLMQCLLEDFRFPRKTNMLVFFFEPSGGCYWCATLPSSSSHWILGVGHLGVGPRPLFIICFATTCTIRIVRQLGAVG